MENTTGSRKKVWNSPTIEELGIEKTLTGALFNQDEGVFSTPLGLQPGGPGGSFGITKK